ncbi:MAG TPA: hypothetical protein VFW21_15320 [Mycobacterium sp.]|nr:hypothetical protein [Mycobacterium sp.]
MTTVAPQTASPDLVPTGPANVYNLHGKGIHLTYFPDGSGPPTSEGPVKLIYTDAHQSTTFHAAQVAVDHVANLGTLVTAVLRVTTDGGTTSVTLLVPSVVMQGAQSEQIHTELITTMHFSPLTGIGRPQRDVYTVTPVSGTASVVILPL